VGCDLTGEHFDTDYGGSLIQTEKWRDAHKRVPVEVYNATLGGDLDVFPRVNIWEII
jgi:hypothetical protein